MKAAAWREAPANSSLNQISEFQQMFDGQRRAAGQVPLPELHKQIYLKVKLNAWAQKTVKKPMMPSQHQPILTDDRFGVGVVKVQVGVVVVTVQGWGWGGQVEVKIWYP